MRTVPKGDPIVRALGSLLLAALLLALGLARVTPVAAADRPAGGAGGGAVGKLAFRDLSGKSYSERDLAGARATLFLFLSSECPISNGYTARILRLAGDYGSRGVRVLGVNPNDHEAVEVVAQHAKERAYPFPVVKDTGGKLARRLGARFTPEAVLVDPRGVVRYRGRIDDNKDATKVQSHDLRTTLDAVLAGKTVTRARTQAFGCAIRFPQPRVAQSAIRNPQSAITYTRDVAPILAQNCQSCHRPGEVGPFPLMTYEQARAWAAQIKDYTHRRVMPPWKAAPGYGEFANNRALTDAQIATLARWADAGAPQGDPKDLPPPRTFTDGWTLGEPDLVLEPSEAYQVAAEGKDVYRCFVLPTKFGEDRYVAAIEARPGNRKVVHHVIAYLDVSGQSEKLDAEDPGPGYSSTGGFPGFEPDGMLGGWAPGNTPARLPDGVGNALPANARIVMEVHYNKSGKPESDRTRLGIYFTRGPVDKKLRMAPVLNTRFRIPPGAERHEVRAGWTVPRDAHALGVTPHMHLLGREIQVSATLPDGTVKPMVWIKDWDFNWQETYAFKEPMALPAGTRIQLVAYYDNSEKNPRNPHRPPKEVGWGEQTSDEMCLAFIGYLVDSEHLAGSPTEASAAADAGPPASVAGAWSLSMETPLGPREATLTLRQEGAKLTGTYRSPMGSEVPVNGTVRGDRVLFSMEASAAGRELKASFDGKLAAGALAGTWEFGNLAAGKWSAARKGE